MTKNSYMPRWLDLRDEVAKSIGLLNAPIPDRQTINVLNNVTRTLMNKQALPDGLKKTFIENIRRRTQRTDFAYDGEIKLTANQIKYARQHSRDQMIAMPETQTIPSSFHPEDGKDELLEAFQRHFIHISSHIQPDFTLLSSSLGLKPAQLLEFWWRNEIKSNEINHESAMTCPSDEMKLAGSPEPHDLACPGHEPAALSGHAVIAHEPAAAGFPEARTIMADDGGKEMTRDVPVPVMQMAHHRTRRPEMAISYFHNDLNKAPSAMFEFGDEKFSLLFATADSAEAKLRDVSDPEWMKWLDAEGGSDLRSASREAAVEGKLSRYVMSPLYAAADKYGFRAPVVQDCAVILGWENDAPATALLVAGKGFYAINLEYFSDGAGKKPLFKGRAAMPEFEAELAMVV